MLFKKLFVFFFLLLVAAVNSIAQDSLNIRWNASSKKLATNEYEIRLKGAIRSGWHLYAKDKQAEGLDGLMISFADSSIQKQADAQFTGIIQKITDKIFENKTVEVITDSITVTQRVKFTGTVPSTTRLLLTYNTASEEFIPEEQKIEVSFEGGADIAGATRILIPSIDLKKPVNDCGGTGGTEAGKGNSGLLTIFLLGFLGGLVALITPCVFPMVPLTVSFFTKKATSKKKGISNAVLYGTFIFLIYIILSLPFHFLDSVNPEILNNISTNVYLNIAFFLVFVFFAFSFFGYYEISLPGSISSGADSKAGVGNIAGIFFMALTLAIVSFSCTGPILGSLLAGSLSGDGGAMQLTSGMAGFGLALALPFALFALFPNWLNALPKSGGWLNTVKVVLGFVELALAFKFLSNADLVKHWGLLKREVFIGIWIITGLLTTLYLLGKIKFPHDSPIKKLAAGRVIVAAVFGLFTLYLIPGITNTKWANLSLISGFPPPLYYSIYQKDNDCVLGLNCTRDYEEGLKMAKAENKPILLDFTGYACVNCRRMEENVWVQPEVYKLMKEKFIVVSLYVDDKKKLPAASQFTYKTKSGLEKEIITVGDKWATFETENFENNAQPLYAIISADEILLNKPVGYTPDAGEYKNWLECGLQAFAKPK
ncbi:MAG: cytochrome c biogenesis protein CcdA [Ferruginibacter sp.]